VAKYEWSEVFYSIEGEAKYAGRPTVYARFALCNFQCKGFGNPEKLDTTKIDVLGFNPADYKDIYSIPLITRGCDSIYSWDPKFKHMWRKTDEHELAQELLNVLPNKSFIQPSGQRVILSLTGGEPTLRAKFLPALFNAAELSDVKHILVETNCAVPLKRDFMMEINAWLAADAERKWTWSNSPKLSVSGEEWDEAIRPEIAVMQRLATSREFQPQQVDQYFKFVCDPTDESFNEVAKAMEEYYTAGIPRNTEVYIMPVACQDTDQSAISSAVAQQCMTRGYIYCHRVHLDVFGNAPGT
jgi:6-pyruvoyltetrahydropterin 2'-reductase